MAAGLALAAAAEVAVAAPPPVPTPAEQQSADCRRPVFATDQLVCSDPDLRALDERLAERLAAGALPTGRWTEPQWQWFQRRSRCAFSPDHRACAEAAYAERLALVDARPDPPSVQTARCGSAEVAGLAIGERWIVLVGRDGGVLGIARSARGGGSWQPYLVAAPRGQTVRLKAATGAALNCRLTPRPMR